MLVPDKINEPRSRMDMDEVVRLSIPGDHPIAADHLVQGQPLLPGLAYVDILLQLARDVLGLALGEFSLKRLVIYEPLTAPADLKIGFKKSKFWSVSVE